MPAGWTAAAIAGAGALGAGSSLAGSGKASSSAKSAANLEQQRYLMTRGDLGPYTATGQAVLPNLTALATGGPTGGGPDYISQAAGAQPGTLTQAQLEAVPGYQFIRDQGLKSVAAQNAAKGLGVSGAEMKGAASYVTGLANQTYMNAFNQQQQQFANLLNLNTAQQGNLTNQFNRLQGTAALGENAAAGTGTIGANLANAQGGFINQAGLANAAGLTGVGSAVNQGVQNYLGYNYLQNLMQNNQNSGTRGIGSVNYTGAPSVGNYIDPSTGLPPTY